MDDLFKRFLACYVGLTVAFWFFAGMMISNGAAYPRNPAWQLISFLRNLFTGGLILGLILYVGFHISEQLAVAEKVRQRIEQKKREDAEYEKQRLIWRAESERREREEEFKRQKEKEERERREEEWRQSQEFKKRNRSAEEAAQDAFDSFLF